MGTKLEPPVSISFLPSAEPRRFDDLDELKLFLDREAARWDEITKLVASKPDLAGTHEAVQRISRFLSSARNHVKGEPPNLDGLRQSLAQFSEIGVPELGSPWGEAILDTARDDPMTGLMMLVGTNPKTLPDTFYNAVTRQAQSTRDMLPRMIEGSVRALLFHLGVHARADAETAALARLRKDAEELNARGRANIDAIEADIRNYRGAIKAYNETAQTEIAGRKDALNSIYKRVRRISRYFIGRLSRRLDQIRDYYRTQLALQEPVSYWTDKGDRSRKAAVVWGVIFTLAVAVTAGALMWNFNAIAGALGAVKPGDQFPNLAVLSIVLAPAFLVFWLLRVIARQMHTNINEMHDARDRVVMAQTFLALLDRGKVDEKDKVLILHALFRPPAGATTGSDDSAPPHWFDLLMDRMKPKP